MSDTIFALSSGRPPAAIGVVRVSGPAACAAVAVLAGGLPEPRRASLRTLRDRDGTAIDRALVIVFPGPATATGEDLVELHCHGGRAVIARVEAALAGEGLRPAIAGEFTRRALANGRIDLAEAEGLADLLEAETEAERRAALDAAEGRVSRAVRGWLDRLALLSAQVEALLDFADEEDVGDDRVLAGVEAERHRLIAEWQQVLAAPSVERLREGVRVAIGGPPNAGKSTLLNRLVERDAAIVSPIAGTTRDRIEAQVVRGGVAYTLIDTAGLTESDDPIEAIGVARAGEAIGAADLVLWLDDVPPPRTDAIWVHARADLPVRVVMPTGRDIAVAENDQRSIDAMWQVVATRAAALRPAPDRIVLRDHQRRACAEAMALLSGDSAGDPIIVAEQLRQAHRLLARLLGVDATEAMLDTLFGRFCIGK